MICNEKLYPITQNLFDALQHIRMRVDVLPLWVDAICINQHQVEEKSIQIANILTIFHKAKEVIAWLGNEGISTSYALQKLRENEAGEFEDEEHPDGQSIERDAVEAGVRELVGRPWFQRVWVRQEVFAARKMELQCGEQKVPWERISHRPEVLSFARRTPSIVQELEAGEVPNPYLVNVDAVQEFGFSYKHLDRADRTDIVNVLNRVANADASDPRDFIYGVLGMSRTVLMGLDLEQNLDALPVDYNKDVTEVFEDVARYVMKRDQCLNTLLLTAHFGGAIQNCKLASWVPDWRLPTSSYPWLEYAKIMRGDVDGYYKSEKPEFALLGSPTIGDGENGVLVLRGFILGHVVSNASQPEGDSMWQLANNMDAHKLIRKLASDVSTTGRFPYVSTITENFLASLWHNMNRKILAAHAGESHAMCKPPLHQQILHNEFSPELRKRHTSLSVEVPQAALYLKKNCPMPLPRILWASGSKESKIDVILGESARPPNPTDTKFVDISADTDMLRGMEQTQELSQRIVQAFYSGSKKNSDSSETTETVSSPKSSKGQPGSDHSDAKSLLRLIGMPLEQWKPKSWLVSNNTQIGDLVLFVHGGLLPVVVREVSGSFQYELVGPAALPEWTFGKADRNAYEWNIWRAESTEQDLDLDLDGATRDRRFQPRHYCQLWLRLLEIHNEDNQLETFHLV